MARNMYTIHSVTSIYICKSDQQQLSEDKQHKALPWTTSGLREGASGGSGFLDLISAHSTIPKGQWRERRGKSDNQQSMTMVNVW